MLSVKHHGVALTLSQTTNFRLPKLKEFADDNSKFDENSGKLYNKVEKKKKPVGKGEIALYEQFLLFPQCFQKTCTAVKTRACLRLKPLLQEHNKIYK